MRTNSGSSRRRIVLAAAVMATVGGGFAARQGILASDHQDTPEVELNPRMDINDVYAFPNAANDRITFIMTTSSPIVGRNASFDPNLLYQLKIDNTGDAVEDVVFQITFDRGSGADQRITVRGPVSPIQTGTVNTLVDDGPEIEGLVNTVLGNAGATQVFAGLRGDPFFIDLEQFFKIVPDRRPSTGPLAIPLTQTATSFRVPGVDFLKATIPSNALAIVIELPKSSILASTAAGDSFGVWGTISR